MSSEIYGLISHEAKKLRWERQNNDIMLSTMWRHSTKNVTLLPRLDIISKVCDVFSLQSFSFVFKMCDAIIYSVTPLFIVWRHYL